MHRPFSHPKCSRSIYVYGSLPTAFRFKRRRRNRRAIIVLGMPFCGGARKKAVSDIVCRDKRFLYLSFSSRSFSCGLAKEKLIPFRVRGLADAGKGRKNRLKPFAELRSHYYFFASLARPVGRERKKIVFDRRKLNSIFTLSLSAGISSWTTCCWTLRAT